MAQVGGTINDRILGALEEAATPLDDNQIATRIGVVRQQVGDRCRHLVRSGLIVRERGVDGRIVNRRSPSPGTPVAARPDRTAPAGTAAARAGEPSDWYWEGHVQASLRDHFVAQGWH